MKKQKAKRLPRIGRTIVPGAAVASGLLSPMAMAAPGDLDPGFADLGRLIPSFYGPAWSVEPQDDGTMFLGGGDFEPYCNYYYYYCGWGSGYPGYHGSNFVGLLDESGTINPQFNAAGIAATQVMDIARQPGGEIVAAGRKSSPSSKNTNLVVFRLLADGAIDSTFASGGIFEIPTSNDTDSHVATSVLLDPDARIVIAGSRNDQLIVLRLLPDGSIDSSFGNSGILAGPEISTMPVFARWYWQLTTAIVFP
jgi:uncharacterized delta-60 repeat protein